MWFSFDGGCGRIFLCLFIIPRHYLTIHMITFFVLPIKRQRNKSNRYLSLIIVSLLIKSYRFSGEDETQLEDCTLKPMRRSLMIVSTNWHRGIPPPPPPPREDGDHGEDGRWRAANPKDPYWLGLLPPPSSRQYSNKSLITMCIYMAALRVLTILPVLWERLYV